MTSTVPIITLQYKSTLQFYCLGLVILGIGIIAYDYMSVSRQVIAFLLAILSIWLFYYSKTTYELYTDKIIRTIYGVSVDLQINTTTLCYEHRPKTTKKGFDKPDNEFIIKTEEPKQQFKIYNTGWENYPKFKKEVEKATKAKVNVVSKLQTKILYDKTFKERVSIAKKEAVTKQKNLYNTIGIGVGVIIFLSGVWGIFRIIVLQLSFIETIRNEPFLIAVGFFVIIYFAMFSKGYD